MTTNNKSNTPDPEKVPRDHHDIERVSAASAPSKGEIQPDGDTDQATAADHEAFLKAVAGNPDRGASAPAAGKTHDIDMRIARDGTWFYLGTPINRQPLVKLFSTVLRHEADGQYYLVTPVEKARITVEDAPFTAVELQVTGDGKSRVLTFRTNVDDEVTLDQSHPLRVTVDDETGAPSPYILVRDNLEALIVRSVFYDLVDLAEGMADDSDRIGVWSSGTCFELGRTVE